MAGGVLDMLVGVLCVIWVLLGHLGHGRLFLEQRLQTVGNGAAASDGAGRVVSWVDLGDVLGLGVLVGDVG